MNKVILPAIPKIEQVAFYVPNIESAKEHYRTTFGIKEWKDDMVTSKGKVMCRIGEDRSKRMVEGVNVAELAFNYDLGYELELINYVSGNNWHRARGRVDDDGGCNQPFQSHMAYHVEDMAIEVNKYERAGLCVIQEVRTISHTSTYLLEKQRKYHYVIFDSRDQLGFDLKLIKRIEAK